MATPLFIKALALNEKVTKYFKVVTPLFYWSAEYHEYRTGESCINRFSWYSFYFLVLLGIWPFATFYVLLKGLFTRHVLPAHLVITFMQGVFWAIGAAFVTYLNVYAEGMIMFLNVINRYFWITSVDRDVFIKSKLKYKDLVKAGKIHMKIKF